MTKMVRLTVEDRLLIKALRIEKGWSVDRMIAEFTARQWKRRTLYYFVRRIDSTGRVERLPGSGRRRSVRTDSNIELVNVLICSQEGQQVGVHGRRRERLEFCILQLRIAKNDLQRRRRRPLPVSLSTRPVESILLTK